MKPASKRKAPAKRPASKKNVTLLSGGNPQIAMGFGDAPVQAWLAAVPDWKRAVCERIDAIIEKTVPGVAKAVKWNSPFYGLERGSWFLSLHVFARYVKVTFFQGTSLKPTPAGASKVKNVRYYDVHEAPGLDEEQLAAWVRQAAALPGERL